MGEGFDPDRIAKYIFLLHFILALIFGVWFFLAPESWNEITGWPPEVASGRIVGVGLLTMAIGSFLAYRASSWAELEIYLVMELVWNILALVGMLWSYVTMALPPAALLMAGLLALFSVLYLYVYFMLRQ
jgi:hypothetical protein